MKRCFAGSPRRTRVVEGFKQLIHTALPFEGLPDKAADDIVRGYASLFSQHAEPRFIIR